VRVAGTFLHEHQTPVHGLMSASPGRAVQGFYILTPLRLRDGSIVIVNRGFVPTELRDASRREATQPDGEVTVTGLVRAPETRGWFIPENDPARNVWFARDPAEIARGKGLGRVAPFLIDADATENPGGWPKGGQTRLAIPNDHLQYALTWFGLALTLLAVFGAFVRRRVRLVPLSGRT
jgi:surfeit locus 1 family protein